MKIAALICLFSSGLFAIFWAMLNASKRADAISDEMTNALLHGDVPSIHPEFHDRGVRR